MPDAERKVKKLSYFIEMALEAWEEEDDKLRKVKLDAVIERLREEQRLSVS
jgi:hypothetical protein